MSGQDEEEEQSAPAVGGSVVVPESDEPVIQTAEVAVVCETGTVEAEEPIGSSDEYSGVPMVFRHPGRPVVRSSTPLSAGPAHDHRSRSRQREESVTGSAEMTAGQTRSRTGGLSDSDLEDPAKQERRGGKLSLKRDIEKIMSDCDIIVGDFNVKLSRLDYQEMSNYKNDASRTVLLKMLGKYDLCDLWRSMNPVSRDFTRMQMVMGNLRMSRIDYCFVKKTELYMYTSMVHKYTALSDHLCVVISMGNNSRGKGGGLWHLNARLLCEKRYIDCITKLIEFESLLPEFQMNILDGWEKLKSKIKYKSIQFVKKLNCEKKKKEHALWEEFIRLRGETVIDTAHLVKIQNEMDMLEKIKCDGAIVRSRAQYVIEGERNTRYFLNLEKQRQEQCSLSVLVDKDGTVIKDFVPLIEHV
ncbi:hypothetical protein ABVT39_017435 [Epinephelus coioides]